MQIDFFRKIVLQQLVICKLLEVEIMSMQGLPQLEADFIPLQLIKTM